MSRNSADFDLPDEILSVIPTDPYDQLDIARRITSLAISSRVSRLEGEAGRLRQNISDRDRVIHELHEKIAHLDRMVQESDARLRETLKENVRRLGVWFGFVISFLDRNWSIGFCFLFLFFFFYSIG